MDVRRHFLFGFIVNCWRINLIDPDQGSPANPIHNLVMLPASLEIGLFDLPGVDPVNNCIIQNYPSRSLLYVLFNLVGQRLKGQWLSCQKPVDLVMRYYYSILIIAYSCFDIWYIALGSNKEVDFNPDLLLLGGSPRCFCFCLSNISICRFVRNGA